MFNKKYKKLLERVTSLSDYLGLAYTENDNWGEYNLKQWGKMKDIEEAIKKLNTKVGIKSDKFE